MDAFALGKVIVADTESLACYASCRYHLPETRYFTPGVMLRVKQRQLHSETLSQLHMHIIYGRTIKSIADMNRVIEWKANGSGRTMPGNSMRGALTDAIRHVLLIDIYSTCIVSEV